MGGDQHQNHAWYGVRMPAVFCRKTRADRIGFQLRTRAHELFGVEASVAQDAVLRSLAVTDNQLPRFNIDVFNSQTQTLIMAQTAAIQNSSKHQISTFEVTKDGCNF